MLLTYMITVQMSNSSKFVRWATLKLVSWPSEPARKNSMSTSNLGNVKTQSELLFEEYLRAHDHSDWKDEAPIEGKPTNPDYRLEFKGVSYFFEVKEFEAQPPNLGFGYFDPYGPLREKVNQAARQFKHYKEFSCSVVLANPQTA